MRAAVFVMIMVAALTGCAMSPETREGISTGASSFVQAASQAVDAVEVGGWAAGMTTLALGIVAAVGKGIQAARRKAAP